jgi:hypothetical protein
LQRTLGAGLLPGAKHLNLSPSGETRTVFQLALE